MEASEACKILDEVLGSSSENVASTLKNLVTNLRQLHPTVTKKLVEVLYMYPSETIPVVPQLAGGTEREIQLLMEALSDLLCSDRQLLVPIVSALGELPVGPKLLHEVRNTVIQALHTVEETDLPVIIRTLLRNLIWSQDKSGLDWIVNEMRNSIRIENDGVLLKLWEALEDCFRVSPSLCTNLLSSWKRSTNRAASDLFCFRVFDLFLILCSMEQLRTRKFAVEILTEIVQKRSNFCIDSLQNLIRKFKINICQNVPWMQSVNCAASVFITAFKENKDLRNQLICDLNCAIRQSPEIAYAAAFCLYQLSYYEEFADNLCSALNSNEDLVAHPHALSLEVVTLLCKFLAHLHKHRPPKTDSTFIMLRKQILFGDSEEKKAAIILAFCFLPYVDSTEANVVINLLCKAIPPCLGHSETSEFLAFIPTIVDNISPSLADKVYHSYLSYVLPPDCVTVEEGVLRYDVTKMVRLFPENILDLARFVVAYRSVMRSDYISSNPVSWLQVETMVSLLIIDFATDIHPCAKVSDMSEKDLLEAASSCVIAIIVLSTVLGKYSASRCCFEFQQKSSRSSDDDIDYLFLSRMEELKTMTLAFERIVNGIRKKVSTETTFSVKELQRIVVKPPVTAYFHAVTILPRIQFSTMEHLSEQEIQVFLAKIDFSIFLWKNLKERVEDNLKPEKRQPSTDSPTIHSTTSALDQAVRLPDAVFWRLFEIFSECHSYLPILRKHISSNRNKVEGFHCTALTQLLEQLQHWCAILLQVLRYFFAERTTDEGILLCWDCLSCLPKHEHNVVSLPIEHAAEKVSVFVERHIYTTEEKTLVCLLIDVLSPFCRLRKAVSCRTSFIADLPHSPQRLKALELHLVSLKTIYPLKQKTLASMFLTGVPCCVSYTIWNTADYAKFFRLPKSSSSLITRYQILSMLSLASPSCALALAYIFGFQNTTVRSLVEMDKLLCSDMIFGDDEITLDISFEEIAETFSNYAYCIFRYWLVGLFNNRFHISFSLLQEYVCYFHDLSTTLYSVFSKKNMNLQLVRSFLKRSSHALSLIFDGIERLTRMPYKFQDIQNFPARTQLEGIVDICKRTASIIRSSLLYFFQSEKVIREKRKLNKLKQHEIRKTAEDAKLDDIRAPMENVFPYVIYHTENVIEASLDWTFINSFERSTDDLERVQEHRSKLAKYFQDVVNRLNHPSQSLILVEEDVFFDFDSSLKFLEFDSKRQMGVADAQSSDDESYLSDTEFALVNPDFLPIDES
eukprot:jgi/Galph1/123/GphlegSOOS_G4788.1